jgi:dihydroorotase
MGLDRLGVGAIKMNYPADLALFDLNREYIFDVSKSYSKSRNTPFEGWKLKGSICYTLLGGEIVYES